MGWLLAPATCPQIPEEMEQHPPQPGCDRQSPQFNQCPWNHRVPVTQLNHRARAEVAAAAAVAVAISPCLQQHVGTVWGIATISGVVVPGAPLCLVQLPHSARGQGQEGPCPTLLPGSCQLGWAVPEDGARFLSLAALVVSFAAAND